MNTPINLKLTNNFLLILSGLPSSGKSTFAKEIKKIVEDHSRRTVKIVDPDVIRTELSPRFDFRLEKKVRKKHLELVENSLKNGIITISDDLNYYSSMRHQLKEIAEKLNKKFYIAHISTPLKICLSWNKARGMPIPNSVINKIFKKFDNFNHYRWDTPVFNPDMSKIDDLETYVINLLKSLDLESKKETTRVSSSNQFAQNLDIITRKMVSELLKTPSYQKYKKKILRLRKFYIKEQVAYKKSNEKIEEDFTNFLKHNLKTNKI